MYILIDEMNNDLQELYSIIRRLLKMSNAVKHGFLVCLLRMKFRKFFHFCKQISITWEKLMKEKKNLNYCKLQHLVKTCHIAVQFADSCKRKLVQDQPRDLVVLRKTT